MLTVALLEANANILTAAAVSRPGVLRGRALECSFDDMNPTRSVSGLALINTLSC